MLKHDSTLVFAAGRNLIQYEPVENKTNSVTVSVKNAVSYAGRIRTLNSSIETRMYVMFVCNVDGELATEVVA